MRSCAGAWDPGASEAKVFIPMATGSGPRASGTRGSLSGPGGAELDGWVPSGPGEPRLPQAGELKEVLALMWSRA